MVQSILDWLCYAAIRPVRSSRRCSSSFFSSFLVTLLSLLPTVWMETSTMSSHSLAPSDWNSIDLEDYGGGRDHTMSHGGSLTKPDLLKSFQIRLMASAESIWAFYHIQGKRKDDRLHFS